MKNVMIALSFLALIACDEEKKSHTECPTAGEPVPSVVGGEPVEAGMPVMEDMGMVGGEPVEAGEPIMEDMGMVGGEPVEAGDMGGEPVEAGEPVMGGEPMTAGSEGGSQERGGTEG